MAIAGDVRYKVRSPVLWEYIGRQVAIARRDANLSLSQLARAAKVTKQMVNLIEQGQRGVALEVLYRIAKSTGQSIEFFLPPVGRL